MSKVQVDTIVNKAGTGAPSFPLGANITGIITASLLSSASYRGQNNQLSIGSSVVTIDTPVLNLRSSSVGIGSTSSPSDTSADGDGILIYGETNKTFTYNNSKKAFESNIPIAPNEVRIITGAEKLVRVDGTTATLSYNSNSANIGLCTNPTGDITLNVVGIPTGSDFNNHSISFTLVVSSTGTARTCTSITLNGVSRTIKWQGGSLGAAISGVTTTTGYSFYNFIALNTVGSALTTTNYEVFGAVNGGFW